MSRRSRRRSPLRDDFHRVLIARLRWRRSNRPRRPCSRSRSADREILRTSAAPFAHTPPTRWYGSPQDQIQAFRAFQIAPQLRERFGYPEITPALRAKIFGLNAAKVYGLSAADIK